MLEREENFEKMLAFVRQKYADTVVKMDELKAADKTKSASARPRGSILTPPSPRFWITTTTPIPFSAWNP